MIPRLFPELLESILRELPIQHGVHNDDSARTLAQCSAASSALRATALLSHIWKDHYLARWNHSQKSVDFAAHMQGDYRLMYYERRRRDTLAMSALDKITADRHSRLELSRTVVGDLGMDVWDILNAQKTDVPPSFAFDGGLPDDWFARNYWAKEIMGSMTRLNAVNLAISLASGEQTDIETGLAIFSGFWGVQLDEILSTLNLLAEECRTHLENLDYILDSSEQRYDRVAIALGICSFMRDKGFVPAIDNYHDLRNNLLHHVLTTHRKSLPLSLASVFVSLAQRLGIPASCVGFPGHVHAFVPLVNDLPERSPWMSYYDAVQGGVHIDVYNSASQPFIDVVRLVRRGQQHRLKPSSTFDIVFRAGRNILTSAQLRQIHTSALELDLSVYAVFCIFLLEREASPARDLVKHITSIVGQHFPLDIGPILQGRLALALPPQTREILEKQCTRLLEEEDDYDEPVDRAPVRYFSGLVFVHRIFDYIGVILSGDDHCHAAEAWIVRFGIDALERGRHQPFYRVGAADGASLYVAEDNVHPIARMYTESEEFSAFRNTPSHEILKGLVDGFPGLGRHFLRPVEGEAGRLIFTPNPELLLRFPGDEEKARLYIEEGLW